MSLHWGKARDRYLEWVNSSAGRTGSINRAETPQPLRRGMVSKPDRTTGRGRRRWSLPRGIPALVLATILGFGSAADLVAQPAQQVSSREVIIRRPRASLRGGRPSARFANLNHRWQVRNLRPAYPFPFGNPELAAQLGLDRLFILDVPEGTDTVRMAAEYRGIDDVEWAQPDVIGTIATSLPNDPSFSLQWNMHNVLNPPAVAGADIDAVNAWKIHTGNLGTVTIAIIDSGVDPHPDLVDRLVPGINMQNPSMPDLTTTVCDRPDNCPGSNGLPSECIHGTHVAGIAAARGNNATGVAGVTWGANIMPVRVADSYCQTTTSITGNGVIWAVDHGADIINISLQFYDFDSPTLRGAVEYAAASGVLVVAAAGNNRGMNVAYPARYPSVVAVSATTDRDTFATEFSNKGPEIDLSAPGDKIWSTYRIGSNYTIARSTGTSMAAPHVAGLAALLLSYNPNLSVAGLKRVMQHSAEDRGDPGWDMEFGYGRINAHRALLMAFSTLVIESADPPDGSIDARQPSEPDGTSPAGWQSVELSFTGDAYREPPTAFQVTTLGGTLSPPTVSQIVPLTRTRIRLVLSRPIEPGAWTIITHKESATFVRLGFLPGDANGDGLTDTLDITDLIEALISGVAGETPAAVDMDRSGEPNLLDLLRQIDLLNGADEFPPFLGAGLPEF